jgi:GDP-L-fucose synthase
VKRELTLLLAPDGFIGSAVNENWDSTFDLVTLNRKDIDFCNTKDLVNRISQIGPSVVINASGRVAGIQGNLDNPVELLVENTEVSMSILRACHESNVSRLIQFASACVYPLNEITPSKPEEIGTGQIEPTSLSYATAKILALEAVRAYRTQYQHDWITIIPTNLYGPGDWSHGSGGHVIAMLIEKFIHAKNIGDDEVSVWGDGKSKRNFLHVKDLAGAVQFILNNSLNDQPVVNLSGNQEIDIRELAFLIRDIVGYSGEVLFDPTKPNGARRKQLDDSYLRNKGWAPKMNLEAGLEDYLRHYLARD